MSTPDPSQASAATTIVCPSCGNRNRPDAERCFNCSRSLEGVPGSRAADEGGVPQAQPVEGGYPGELSAPFLEVLGYLTIVFGVILGIWTISTLGTTEVPAYDAFGVYTDGGRRANGLAGCWGSPPSRSRCSAALCASPWPPRRATPSSCAARSTARRRPDPTPGVRRPSVHELHAGSAPGG